MDAGPGSNGDEAATGEKMIRAGPNQAPLVEVYDPPVIMGVRRIRKEDQLCLQEEGIPVPKILLALGRSSESRKDLDHRAVSAN